ncbi:hypothetical protein C1H46_000288 [Malus baccata]|uniref:Uncharacterized protein n=1 Tax=Malus baccata TaxID=106549 RepID=A0A540NTM6_MALBA|nr:hypothetical protein C1H46_000288 [Malus baccata]
MRVYNSNINYYVWAPANCDWLARYVCFLEERIAKKMNIIGGPRMELGLEFVLE